jgi:predicted short-subunit dehydrogenase-like oxidoreductase (DUF2520 family)
MLHSREPKRLPVALLATSGPLPPWLADVEIILLAVPDDIISVVAEALAASGRIGAKHCVLHLSGVSDRSALSSLTPTGAALGSLHPFQTLVAPAEAPARLRGAAAGIEGDARARELASGLARSLGMEPVEIPAGRRAEYHAAGVFAANYTVTLAAVAARLLQDAGCDQDLARRAVAALMRAAVENSAAAGPEHALTGPVARGDAHTIERHLAALQGDTLALYRALARATLGLADLPPDRRAAIERLLME